MANQFFNNDGSDDEPNYVPGVSPEELKALEDERTMFDETEVQMAQRMLKANLIGAVHTMTKLALNSGNERIRMAAAQYVIERNMGRVQDNAPAPADDPIADLLATVVSDVDMGAIKAFAGRGDNNGDDSGDSYDDESGEGQ